MFRIPQHFVSNLTARRGVLLLVVLSMLTLFLLLGVTFLVLASRARTVSKAYLQLADQQQQSAETMWPFVREAAFQVIRGTEKKSALKNHDLLGDRYTKAMSYTVLEVNSVVDDELLDLVITIEGGSAEELIDLDHTGCVLGFDNTGPAAVQGTATRIVNILENTPAINKTTLTIPWPKGLSVTEKDRLRQTQVWINGRDFAGPGVVATKANSPNWSLVTTVNPDGMNEDYDANDLQNIALAEVDLSTASYDSRKSINYWLDWYKEHPDVGLSDRNAAEAAIFKLLSSDPSTLSGVQLQIVKEIRRASCRPFAYDHTFVTGEDFTGKPFSNAQEFFDLLRGEEGFDVDTDGDGQLDSVWVDFGREAFRLPDRTLVKPLAAIRCIDLGGRINLNVHGSPAHYQSQNPTIGSDLLTDVTDANPPYATSQPVGLGFGPADVRLDTVLDRTQIGYVLNGRSTDLSFIKGNGVYRRLRNVRGRYGSGSKTPGNRNDSAGDNQRDPTWQTSISGLLPSDYSSRYAIGLDRRGHPLFLDWSTSSNDAMNSPYELNLFEAHDCTPYDPIRVNGTPVPATDEYDQPFTATEMEALFRLRDADNASLLSQRLLAIFIDSDPDILRLLTTDSWDTPAVIGDIPTLSNSSNLEIKRGLKLNLNRPFGDGLDNDGDGAVDDPSEIVFGDPDSSDPYFAAFPDDEEDNDGDGTVDEYGEQGWKLTRGATIGNADEPYSQPGPDIAGIRARQIMAKNLFVLMSSLKNSASLSDADISPRDLAQWAVNVVDFIDRDAIMTPFRYADGTAAENVVWGCENPDLIITETLAFHDRAIADTDDDNGDDDNPAGGSGKSTTDGSDANFDQIRVPQGSLFVELHATRNPQAYRLPRELYSGSQGNWKLDLGKKPQGSTTPIWRLSFADQRTGDLNDPFKQVHEDQNATLASTYDNATSVFSPGGFPVNRFAYFTPVLDLPDGANHRTPNKFNTFRASAPMTLECGSYLVAGPRTRTYLGSTTTGATSPQFIDILNNGVRKTHLKGGYKDSTSYPESFGCVLTADKPEDWVDPDIDHSIGLNISEPTGNEYYDEPQESSDITYRYQPRLDEPLNSGLLAGLRAQGTHLNASTVFIERLADPTRPFNPDPHVSDWNPYIIVDFAAIDLTVFNGETSDNCPDVGSDVATYPHSRQRGFDAWINQDPANNSELFSLSKVETGDPDRVFSKYPWRPCSPYEKSGGDWVLRPPQTGDSSAGHPNAYFDFDIGVSTADTIPNHTLGWCNLSQGRRGNFGSDYVGVPENPFPWLAWKDGPLANPYELLLVPRTSASRLLTDYRDVGEITDADETYEDSAMNSKPYGVDDDQPFGATRPGHHLLPLTSITDKPLNEADPKTPVSDALSKVFSYVRTPSPFAGTGIQLSDAPPSDRPYFHEPFNKIETYREPGKINVNTIRDQRVWNALTGDNGIGLQPAWPAINNAFAGQGSPARTAASGRSNTLLADGSSGTGVPLFPTPTSAPPAAFDSGRSSWFRFAPLIRAAANSTQRSEVYAIWVTVGLFEVEYNEDVNGNVIPGIIDLDEDAGPLIRRYPESHRLLREYGRSTGEVKRYRGFYIFDRSRAITYEPGVDHNVEDGLLVERLIQ